MRRRRSSVVGVVALGVVACIAATARAQQDTDERRIQRFVDDVGKTLYFLAWPFAKYEGVRFNGLSRVAGGADAKLTLSGISALDGDDLWTEVVLEIRNGRISNVRWGRHNALVFKPGETVSALGDVLAELNKQYARGNAGGAPLGRNLDAPATLSLAAICLNNTTSSKISYQVSWSGKSEGFTLEPGQARLYWSGESSPSFTISFDDSFVPGYTERRMRLVGTSHPAQPSTCEEVTAYDFVVDSPAIGVASRSWVPGVEHPFRAHLVRGEKKDNWSCPPGYKLLSPEVNKLECIENSVGFVGMALEKEDGFSYPKIASVVPGSSADKAGLAPGLFVLAINGMSTEDKTVDAIIPKIRGTVGTTVRVSVTGGAADEPPRTLTLTRR